MSMGPAGNLPKRPSIFRNWVSMMGAVVALGSLFAFLLLFVINAFAHFSNPYVGVLTYLVSPAFLVLGVTLVLLGGFLQHRRILRAMPGVGLQIDLTSPRDRRRMAYFLTGSVLFLMVSAIGSYYTYHFTESVMFCGSLCHTVMQPEMVTYQHSPHARVNCTSCHIGAGATWYVRSKLSGAYQVYATIANKYPRPIPTPVHNLRPAPETCETCHWPREFVGNVDRTLAFYLGNQSNSFHAIRLLLKVGGADPSHGPVGGIHWHMNVANQVLYYPVDEFRQKIPWVKLIDSQGVVSIFRTKGFTNDPPADKLRRMDCMDCHNRPSHIYQSPNDAINLAMNLQRIDASLPWIKTNAVYSLVRPYATAEEGLREIDKFLSQKYPAARSSILAVQQIYTNNFFPAMKANWRVYPNNIGHKDWPGCSRCHDDKHVTADGKRAVKFKDCSQCHIILAQGSGAALDRLTAKGQAFQHPEEEYPEDYLCSDCHSGGP